MTLLDDAFVVVGHTIAVIRHSRRLPPFMGGPFLVLVGGAELIPVPSFAPASEDQMVAAILEVATAVSGPSFNSAD